MNTISQKDRILKYMLSGGTLDPLKALKLFNCWALSSRISEINNQGYKVKSEMVEKKGKRYAKYSIPI